VWLSTSLYSLITGRQHQLYQSDIKRGLQDIRVNKRKKRKHIGVSDEGLCWRKPSVGPNTINLSRSLAKQAYALTKFFKENDESKV